MKGGEEILHIDNICKNFDLGRGKVLKACDCVDIIVHKAETVGIVGESGSGKSTVAKMLTRLYDISAGKIIFHGEDITRLKGEALRQHRKKIQMVFQDPSTAFNPKMRVRDIICEPLKNFGMIKNSEVDAKAREMLRLVELPAVMPIICQADSGSVSPLQELWCWNRKSSFVMKRPRHWICPYRKP